MPEKEPTQEEAVEALKELDREQLKKLNKEQGLGVRVKSMSDDDLRAAIAEAMDDEEPEEPTEEKSPEEAESGGIRSRLPGRESLPVSPATLGLAAVAVVGGAIGVVLLARRGSGQSEPTD